MANPRRRATDRRQSDALVQEYRQTGDTVVRDRLISEHLYLVHTVARKFAGLGESHEDLLQEGAMGLINAVDLYDPDRGVQFSTYATHLVDGQIRHYLRDKGKLIKQPAWVQEFASKIHKAVEALTQQLNRQPTLPEIAERVGTDQDNVKRILEAGERSKVASLDAVTTDDDGQGPAIDSEKLRVQRPDAVHLPVEDRIFLREAMSKLKTLERKVVHHFYYMDLNQTEIARKLGISVNYASYLLRGAVAKLKKAFEAQERASIMNQTPDEAPADDTAGYSLSARPAPADPLTKLATEEYFVNRVGQEVNRARRYPQQFAVLLLEPDAEDLRDADHVALARLLRNTVRSVDLVARLRGLRFGLLLAHTGRESSVLAERLLRSVAGRLNISGKPLTASVGLAVFPTDGRDTEAILAAAEQALVEARHGGGNQHVRLQSARRSRPAGPTPD